MPANMQLQTSIEEAIQQLTTVQQVKLLEFIQALLQLKEKHSPQKLLQFVGKIDHKSLREMEEAIKDCEQIDEDEW